MEITSFKDFNISENLLKAIDDMEFSEPTEIQKEVIPLMLEGKDIIGQAPTGTGKTCAFLIPIVNNVDKESESVQVIVMCPTRELVLQTTEELKNVMKYTEKVRVLPIYGGQNIERQLFGLRKRPQIIIGTPGRVIDHLERKTLKLNDLKALVLDEADEMLDMGFREDIDRILEKANIERQTVLFSATMPKEIIELSKNYQKDPTLIKTKLKENEIPEIEQFYSVVSEKEKIRAITSLLDNNKFNLGMVFVNTKKRAQELAAILIDYGYSADALHGDLRQSQRDNIMKRFRSNEIKFLIATDVAARGIDVDDIEVIINYDIPFDDEYYVHRIGRTARANKKGAAYSFVTPGQVNFIKDFEKITKTKITKTELVKDENKLNMDDKKLKIAFSKLDTNLEEYKELIRQKLDEYNNDKDTEFDYLDLLAAMMRTDNELPSLSEAGLRTSKERKSRQAMNPDAVKLFINVGTRDKATEQNLKTFIIGNTDILADEIFEVKLLENFGFVQVKDVKVPSIMKLTGNKFNNREINIEVAGDKPAKRERKESSGSSKRDYAGSGKKEYGDKKREFAGSRKRENTGSGKKDFNDSESFRSEKKPYEKRKSYAPSNKEVFEDDTMSFIKNDPTFRDFEEDMKDNGNFRKASGDNKKPQGKSYGGRKSGGEGRGRKSSGRYSDSRSSGRYSESKNAGRFSESEVSAETFSYKKDSGGNRGRKSNSVFEGNKAPRKRNKSFDK